MNKMNSVTLQCHIPFVQVVTLVSDADAETDEYPTVLCDELFNYILLLAF